MDTYSFTYSVVNNRVTVLFPNDEKYEAYTRAYALIKAELFAYIMNLMYPVVLFLVPLCIKFCGLNLV